MVRSGGSLRKDGAMGAAYASNATKENGIPARSLAVKGSPSSIMIRQELTCMAMGCDDVWRGQGLTTLTDSQSRTVLLKSLQHRDLQSWLISIRYDRSVS